MIEGPGFTQWDLSAIKNIRIRESTSLQFRAEFFNIFNQTNYRLPNNDINSPNFGKIREPGPAAGPVSPEISLLR